LTSYYVQYKVQLIILNVKHYWLLHLVFMGFE